MAKQEERKKLLEREYIFNLREEIMKAPRYRKAEKAVSSVRKFLIRHMKVYDEDEKKIKLSKWLNEYLWKRGIRNPPTKIKIKAVKYDDGIVEAELMELTKKAEIEKKKEQARKEEAAKIEQQKEEEAKKAEEAAAQNEEVKQEIEAEKAEEKEAAENLKEEERLLEKDLEKQAKRQKQKIEKPAKDIHKKALTGV